MLFFCQLFGPHVCHFWAHFEGHFWLNNEQTMSLKSEQKRDPGRRGPRKLAHGHSVVVYHASGRTLQHPTSSIAKDHGL